MFAPVACRFITHDEHLSTLDEYPVAKQYVLDVYSSSYVQEWVEAAKNEPADWKIKQYEAFGDKFDESEFKH